MHVAPVAVGTAGPRRCCTSGNAFQGVLQAATRETEGDLIPDDRLGAAFAAMGCLLVFVFWRRGGEVEPALVLAAPRAR